MLTALGIAVAVVGIPVIIIGAMFKPAAPSIPFVIHPVTLPNFVVEHPHVAQPHHPHTHVSPPPAATTPHAITNPMLVPVANPPAPTVQPTRTDPVPTDLGPVSTGIDDGTKGGTGKTPGVTAQGDGDGAGNAPFNAVEIMPEPVGGAAAWSKFLNKNLKYPDMAVDNRIYGKVWVSFIVEKDGHLSNIVVERGLGYGTNEEAIRVLKMAPAWKPGIQNGQPVRVRYELPINFQINDDTN